jgi:hypothetical protein
VLLVDGLADQLHLLGAVVGVIAFGIEKCFSVELCLLLGARVGRRETGLYALGHDLLGLRDKGVDHLVLGHHTDDFPLDEQVPSMAPCCYP